MGRAESARRRVRPCAAENGARGTAQSSRIPTGILSVSGTSARRRRSRRAEMPTFSTSIESCPSSRASIDFAGRPPTSTRRCRQARHRARPAARRARLVRQGDRVPPARRLRVPAPISTSALDEPRMLVLGRVRRISPPGGSVARSGHPLDPARWAEERQYRRNDTDEALAALRRPPGGGLDPAPLLVAVRLASRRRSSEPGPPHAGGLGREPRGARRRTSSSCAAHSRAA